LVYGDWLLVIGDWLFVAGCWLLVLNYSLKGVRSYSPFEGGPRVKNLPSGQI
jgi:hypothetical protein